MEYSYQQSVSSQMEQRGGAIYRQSILTNEEFKIVQKELSTLTNRLNDETASTVAVHRQGARLAPNSQTYKILKSGSLFDYIRKVSGDDSMVLSTNLPVEVRLYEKVGASMAWHEDDVLYDPPQVEAVITIENNSDCVTMWKDGEKLLSRETDPNSVLLLQAGGPLHCVTSLKRGRRLILKCAYRSGNASYREGIHKETFGVSKSSKRKKQKSKR
ncbi:unnamed protein product [Cylindrotheca closterium]|uniref:Uncharacterized protein n=1 Tax=Cylindrotheca closterium TaxID=2856 RepID=A0AAD2PY37_9STRA|nr:unnamed protein product [Cylindrotheca closterium]